MLWVAYNEGPYSRKVWRYLRGQSETVNRGITDNTMVKRKSTKNDLQNTTQKTKIEQHEPQ